MLIDLHSHSYYSDGIFNPKEVIKMAKDSKCNLFSLTDHDTTLGIIEAKNEAKKLNINFVSGVEISCTWSNMTIHIIGLGLDINNKYLQSILTKHQNIRILRAEKIAQGLEAAGIKDALQNTKKLVKKQMITRTHFARMLINHGICKDMPSVFKRYLTAKKPGGANVVWSELNKVINVIHDSNGVAIIAHPLRYRMTNTKIKRLLVDFKVLGGDAVEVITGSSSLDDINLLLKWSAEFNLKQSSGSDFHGDNNYIKIGKLKNISLPNPIWQDLC